VALCGMFGRKFQAQRISGLDITLSVFQSRFKIPKTSVLQRIVGTGAMGHLPSGYIVSSL
jgi:hypothetical protein